MRSSNALAALRIVFRLRLTPSRLAPPLTRSRTSSSRSTVQDRLDQPARQDHAVPEVGEHDHDPLNVTIRTSPLGLPLSPLPLSIPTITPSPVSRETLHRLHRLSALNPPVEGSEEEKALMDELGTLFGLMEMVKEVEMPFEDVGQLLGEGVREVVIDGSHLDIGGRTGGVERSVDAAGPGRVEKRGRELLEHATRRVGDFYASRTGRESD